MDSADRHSFLPCDMSSSPGFFSKEETVILPVS